MYSITYNDENCLAYRIVPVRRPSVPAPEVRVEETEIPGMDGALVENYGTYGLITIPIEFNFLSRPLEWMGTYRAVKKWLKGSGWLKLGDDRDYLYKVYYVNITDTERTSIRIGSFTAEFVCYPYAYLESGQQEYTAAEVAYNPYEVSHPTYLIAGEGMCTLTVNGKTMTANVGQNLTIDTDRMLAYRRDGTMQNTAVTGDYTDLYLLEGENSISITSGFSLSVIPNWRCL